MKHLRHILLPLLAALSLTLLAGAATADDAEIFFSSGNANSQSAPNILLIFDTSGSMATVVSQSVLNGSYSSGTTYGQQTVNGAPLPGISTTAGPAGGLGSGVAPAVGSSSSGCTTLFTSTAYYAASSTGVPACGAAALANPTASQLTSNCPNLVSQLGSAGYVTTQVLSWAYSSKTSSSTGYWFWTNALGNSNYLYASGVTYCKTDAASYATANTLPLSLSGNISAGGSTTGLKSYCTSYASSGTGLLPVFVGTASRTVYPGTGTGSCASSGTSSAYTFKTNPTLSGGWTDTSTTSVTFYTGNYLNWLYFNNVTYDTRLSIVQKAATTLVNSLYASNPNINVGLMRYNADVCARGACQGGHVVTPIAPLSSNLSTLLSSSGGFSSYVASGHTPLTETLYEAYLYFAGLAPYFGAPSATSLNGGNASIASSISGGKYASPIVNTCQKNIVVFLTDGAPTSDSNADTYIKGLAGANSCTDANYITAINNSQGSGSASGGICLSALTKYMFNNDLSQSLQGVQNVQTDFIAFGGDAAYAFNYLQNASQLGGGAAYTATDLATLEAVFAKIQKSIVLQTASTFTAPAVAVNAFNRTQTLDSLYVSEFLPSATFHWAGNLKNYTLSNNLIVDANGVAAVDPTTGFFAASSVSGWTAPTVDGASVPAGGAASLLSGWDPTKSPHRNLYTWIGTNPASPTDMTASATTQLTTSNTSLTPALVGGATTTDLTNFVNYARGENLLLDNTAQAATGNRLMMGDGMHSEPAAVTYGGTTAAPDVLDSVVFVADNDGFLHAIETKGGTELWAFMPDDALPNLSQLYANNIYPPTANPNVYRHYALDGTVKVLKYDQNGDGIVDPANDRVFAYVAEGRGGNAIYALDVTTKTAPKFMWKLSGLSNMNYTWSTPMIAKVNVASASQTSVQKLVLIFAGGYDPGEDSGYQVTDTTGNMIYMVDAVTGAVLWSGGGTGSGATTVFPAMDHAIPSDITLLDTNGDGYADRMYVGDMGGQLWRFDITNGNAPSSLVAGGVIASLGGKVSNTPTETRRFYNAPDVAVVRQTGQTPYINIAIGSGYRGHPKADTTTQDRMYAIRDFSPYTAMTQAQYDAYTPITDAGLIDITTNLTPTIAPNAPGWKLLLNQNGGWDGEKVLSASTTIDNEVLFATYTPAVVANAASCTPGYGTNRIYAVSVVNGAPVANLNNQNNTSIADRSKTLAQTGIAPALAFLFPSPTAVNSQLPSPTSQNQVLCLSGAELLGACKGFQSRVKTYWKEADAR